jgi:hypothetical protein
MNQNSLKYLESILYSFLRTPSPQKVIANSHESIKDAWQEKQKYISKYPISFFTKCREIPSGRQTFKCWSTLSRTHASAIQRITTEFGEEFMRTK